MAKVRRLDHMPLARPVEGGLAALAAGAGVGVRRCVVVRCYVRVKWQRRRRGPGIGSHELRKQQRQRRRGNPYSRIAYQKLHRIRTLTSLTYLLVQ
jgi:hypothetical protein